MSIRVQRQVCPNTVCHVRGGDRRFRSWRLFRVDRPQHDSQSYLPGRLNHGGDATDLREEFWNALCDRIV